MVYRLTRQEGLRVTSASENQIRQFETWYETDMPRLFSYISYRVRERAIAEDLTAAVLETAAANLHRYDVRRGTFDAWILGIARHKLMHYMRSYRTANPMLSLDVLPDVRADGDSIEEIAETIALTQRTLIYVSQLPEREQEIIALRYGMNMNSEQIARLMDLSAGNVRVLLHRAIEKLQRLLLSECEDENA
jgi:RNA polymerase sigma-70 factor, ECF subfamily